MLIASLETSSVCGPFLQIRNLTGTEKLSNLSKVTQLVRVSELELFFPGSLAPELTL